MIEVVHCCFQLLCLCGCALSLAGQTATSEADYIQLVQRHLGGEIEVPVTDGRVDIQTDIHAIEVEFAHKWKQAIGQALWYAHQTNLEAGIVLIMRSPAQQKYLVQLNSTLNYANLGHRVSVWVWPIDFQDSPSVRLGRVAPASYPPTTGYWLSIGSKKRHNASCVANYEQTNGRPCAADEGQACGICGG